MVFTVALRAPGIINMCGSFMMTDFPALLFPDVVGVVQECEVPHTGALSPPWGTSHHFSLEVAKSSCFCLLYANESAHMLTRLQRLKSYANRARKWPDLAHVDTHMHFSFSSF